MNRLRIFLPVSVLFASLAAQAYSPAPPLPLADRVKLSSHIFIGEIRSVYFVDESGRPISAYQAARQTEHEHFDPIIETKLRVHETLLARKGRLSRVVLFRRRARGAGYFQPEDRPKGLAKWIKNSREDIGTKYIFLTERVAEKGKPTVFYSSYGDLNREDVNQRIAILKAVQNEKAGQPSKRQAR